MERVIKKGLTVTKVLVWNRTTENDTSECELTFSDGSTLTYECKDVYELDDDHIGIYELLEDGTYRQVEDWEK